MAALSDITLMMPTYNRTDYAVRTMRFWSNKGVILHVLDGGEDPISNEILDSLGSNIKYHHSGNSIYDRVAYATTLVETKYCALLEDDSFLLLDGLRACMNELEENPELASCNGCCIAFKFADGDVCGEPQFPEFETHNIMNPNPLARIEDHLRTFTPTTVYSLMRTPAWKRAAGMLGKKSFLPATMGELPFEIGAVYHGCAKVLPRALWLRSIENESHPVEGAARPLAHWWSDPSMGAARSDLVKDIIAELNPTESEADVEVALRKALDAYSEHCRRLEAKTRPPSDIQTFAIRVRKACFGWLPRGLKSSVLRMLRPAHYKPYRPLLTVAGGLANRGIAFDAKNLVEVVEIVKSFHSRRRVLV